MDFVFINDMAWKHAQAQRAAKVHAGKDGHWYASLIHNNPRIVQSFVDHEEVAARLAADGELQTLFDVAAGGLLDAPDSRAYRAAYREAISA
jgi:hypothetical protein